MDAEAHLVNRLKLLNRLSAQLAGFKQEELGVAENRSERVIDGVLHFEHITAKNRFAFVLRGAAECLTELLPSGSASQRFAGNKNKSLWPFLAWRNVEEIRITRAQLVDFVRIESGTKDYNYGGRKCRKNL